MFYNGISYEISLITICLECLPTKDNEDKRNEIIWNCLKEIINSAISLSPSNDLLSSLSNGALFLF